MPCKYQPQMPPVGNSSMIILTFVQRYVALPTDELGFDLDQREVSFSLTRNTTMHNYFLLHDDGGNMQFNQQYYLSGYEYHVFTALTNEKLHRGIVIFVKRGDTEEFLDLPVAIETPSAFKTIRAAEIEASVYAHELILSGAIRRILGPSVLPVCSTGLDELCR